MKPSIRPSAKRRTLALIGTLSTAALALSMSSLTAVASPAPDTVETPAIVTSETTPANDLTELRGIEAAHSDNTPLTGEDTSLKTSAPDEPTISITTQAKSENQPDTTARNTNNGDDNGGAQPVKKGTFGIGTEAFANVRINEKPNLDVKEFTYNYKCGDEEGVVVTTGDAVPVDVGKDFPVGTTCTVELDMTDVPIEHYTNNTPPVKTLTITEEPQGAGFHIDYLLIPAWVTISKEAQGAPNLKDRTFYFQLSCTLDGDPITKITSRNLGSVSLPVGVDMTIEESPTFPFPLPAGAECTVTEDTSGAQIEGYTLEATESVTLTLEGDVPETLFALENNYTRDTGTFTITKSSTGVDTKDKLFTFNYTCGDQNGSIVVPGNGKITASKVMVPTGTQCTITEDAKSGAITGYTHTPPPPQTFIIQDKGDVVDLSFTNAYKPITAKIVPGTALAHTGATTPIIMISAFVFLILGLMAYTRKHSR